MAYADKITTMRRMTIIVKDHNIEWEGVNIEGTCLLRSYADGFIMVKSESELKEWLERENDNRFGEAYTPLVIKYQDKKTKKFWEPRKKGYC